MVVLIIPLNDDAIDEWNETFIIDLSNKSNATASGNQSITVTINDEVIMPQQLILPQLH